MNLRLLVFFAVLLPILTGCHRTLSPEKIDLTDTCDFCRMAISQARFAGELLMDNGDIYKFDDIGCLLQYRERLEKGKKVAVCFVTDYESKQWIRAENAFFVRSTTLSTPMNSGLVAYGTQSAAEQAAARTGGRILRWSNLWT